MIINYFDGDTGKSSLALGVIDGVGGLLAFLLAPIIGLLSDEFGRKPFIVLSLITSLLPVGTIALELPFPLYFLFRGLSGIFATSLGILLAYVCDCAPADKRTLSFGLVMAAFSGGAAFSPLLSIGLSVDRVFDVAAIIGTVNIVVAIMFLPESLHYMSPAKAAKPARPHKVQEGGLRVNQSEEDSEDVPLTAEQQQTKSSSSSCKEVTSRLLCAPVWLRLCQLMSCSSSNCSRTFKQLAFLWSSPYLKLLSSSLVLQQLAMNGMIDVSSLFFTGILHYSQNDLAVYMTCLGCSLLGAQMILLPICVKCLKLSERTILVFSNLCHALHYAVFLMMDSSLIWIAPIALCLAPATMGFAASNALAAAHVDLPTKKKSSAHTALSESTPLTPASPPASISSPSSLFPPAAPCVMTAAAPLSITPVSTPTHSAMRFEGASYPPSSSDPVVVAGNITTDFSGRSKSEDAIIVSQQQQQQPTAVAAPPPLPPPISVRFDTDAAPASPPSSRPLMQQQEEEEEEEEQEEDYHGRTQAALNGMRAVTRGIGPLIFTTTFSLGSSPTGPFYYPRIPFAIGLAFVLGAFVLSAFLPKVVPKLFADRDAAAQQSSKKEAASSLSNNTDEL